MRAALIITAVLGLLVGGVSVIGYYRVAAAAIDIPSELQQYRDTGKSFPDTLESKHRGRIKWLGDLWVPAGLLGVATLVTAFFGLLAACSQHDPEAQPNAEPSAGPNDEERGQPHVPGRASLARSSSSVSFALGNKMSMTRIAGILRPLGLVALSFGLLVSLLLLNVMCIDEAASKFVLSDKVLSLHRLTSGLVFLQTILLLALIYALETALWKKRKSNQA